MMKRWLRDFLSTNPLKECGTGCLVGKHLEKRYEVGKETRAYSTLDLIHSDVSRPIPTTSMSGSKYFLTFIDDCSRYCWVYFMKQKSEAFDTFKVFKSLVENTFINNMNSRIYDNGVDYVKRYFQHICASVGI